MFRISRVRSKIRWISHERHPSAFQNSMYAGEDHPNVFPVYTGKTFVHSSDFRTRPQYRQFLGNYSTELTLQTKFFLLRYIRKKGTKKYLYTSNDRILILAACHTRFSTVSLCRFSAFRIVSIIVHLTSSYTF